MGQETYCSEICANDDSISLNSQGVEVHHLSEEGADVSPVKDHPVRRKKSANKKKVSEASRDKSAVDPCKYKTKLCRSWARDGFCSYENVCCYAHGESDLRTVHQNTQVLSTLGYFNELLLLSTDFEQPALLTPKVLKGKKVSKEDLKAAQVEASLIHFARNSAAQVKANRSQPPSGLAVSVGPLPTPQPQLLQPAEPMVHVPYSTPGKQMSANAVFPAASTEAVYPGSHNPYGQICIRHPTYLPFAPPTGLPTVPRHREYTLIPAGVPLTGPMSIDENPPWKYPPGAEAQIFGGNPVSGHPYVVPRFRAP